MRRLIWSLILIVALLAILDRVALAAAEHDVSERLKADAHLSSSPSVHIHGYPFLTQLLGGNYDDVDVVMRDVDAGAVQVDRLTVHVHGAHVSLGDVVSQDRSRVRIDRAVAELLITDAALDNPNLTGVSVSGGDTVVLHTKVGDVPVKLTGLPFGIRLTSAKTTQDGIEVTGEARGLILHT